MKKLTGKSMCWLLTLTLTGLPFATLDADMLMIVGSDPCVQMSTPDTDSHMPQASTETADADMSELDCGHCRDHCRCAAKPVCHATASHHQLAFFLTDTLPSTSDQTKLYPSSLKANHYHSRVIDPEKHPPII